jgi:hypothetical protein
MTKSLHIFMARIIDYAGLFPPAALGMSDAFDEFVEHRMSSEGWMLARFVCPATRLAELVPLLDRLDDEEPPVMLSVLGRGGGTRAAFAAAVDSDLQAIADATSAQPRAAIDQFEVRLPGETVGADLTEVVRDTMDRLDTVEPFALIPFFETSLLEGWQERLPDAVSAVVEGAGGRNVGFKIRCGGIDASAVPSPVAVAAAIVACRRARLPLKATQGLHHPVRHFDPRLGALAHGFLNLFVAGMLAHARGVSEEELLAVIEEEDPSAFSFSEENVAWREYHLELDQVAAGRRHAVASFGSCSFAEPRDDLRQLGLLERSP